MSFIVVTVSDWHCCNIDYHKSNTLDRNKQYISKNKVWSGTIFWKPFAVVRRQFPFPECFLFRTVRLQRPGISLWLIARPKTSLIVYTVNIGLLVDRTIRNRLCVMHVLAVALIKNRHFFLIFILFSFLPSLCFLDRSENKMATLASDWLAETFSTSPLKPLNGI